MTTPRVFVVCALPICMCVGCAFSVLLLECLSVRFSSKFFSLLFNIFTLEYVCVCVGFCFSQINCIGADTKFIILCNFVTLILFLFCLFCIILFVLYIMYISLF